MTAAPAVEPAFPVAPAASVLRPLSVAAAHRWRAVTAAALTAEIPLGPTSRWGPPPPTRPITMDELAVVSAVLELGAGRRLTRATLPAIAAEATGAATRHTIGATAAALRRLADAGLLVLEPVDDRQRCRCRWTP